MPPCAPSWRWGWRALRAVPAWSAANASICEADKLGQPPRPTLADVRRLQAMKTGALIRYACEAGAMLGGGDVEQRRALAVYGERLGRAFQIADDLLDVEGEAATVGKATGKDAGKATLVSLMGVDAAKAELAKLEAEALAALQPFGARADVLREAAAFVVRRQAWHSCHPGTRASAYPGPRARRDTFRHLRCRVRRCATPGMTGDAARDASPQNSTSSSSSSAGSSRAAAIHSSIAGQLMMARL